MKRIIFFMNIVIIALLFSTTNYAQLGNNRDLQYYRFPDQRGLNTFETSKYNTVKFEGLKVVVGVSSTIQFQGLSQSNNAAFKDNGSGKNVNQLIKLGKDFNLATANLDINVQLADGLRMYLGTYLTSRHHLEAWVKGGYIQIDKLDFISKGFLKNLMKSVT
ncbi:MAG TPA: hypothetical protein ENI57_02390, partial [Ignavibacteria bacterium]|nr:hypothetical protein [Ignavibacteria bacterium]